MGSNLYQIDSRYPTLSVGYNGDATEELKLFSSTAPWLPQIRISHVLPFSRQQQEHLTIVVLSLMFLATLEALHSTPLSHSLVTALG